MPKTTFSIGVALALSVFSSAAHADASKCSDILAQGVFQTTQIRDNSYFQQIIYSRFARSSYQSSSSDRGGGFGIPVGEIVLGGNYSEATFRRKQEEIQSTYLNQINQSREIDVALASGDPTIINAWSECMRNRGGLNLRFEPAGTTDIFAYLEWFPVGNQASTKLTSNVVFPAEITIVSGKDCFKKGKKIGIGNACRALLRSSSSKKPVAVAVNSTNDSTQAFLPARIAKIRDVVRHPGSSTRALLTEGFRNYLQPTGSLDLTDAQLKEGWTIDHNTATARLYVVSTHGGMNACTYDWRTPEPHRFSFGFTIWGHTRGNDRNRHIWCAMDVSALMWRDRWVGIDELSKSLIDKGIDMNDKSYQGLASALPTQKED